MVPPATTPLPVRPGTAGNSHEQPRTSDKHTELKRQKWQKVDFCSKVPHDSSSFGRASKYVSLPKCTRCVYRTKR